MQLFTQGRSHCVHGVSSSSVQMCSDPLPGLFSVAPSEGGTIRRGDPRGCATQCDQAYPRTVARGGRTGTPVRLRTRPSPALRLTGTGHRPAAQKWPSATGQTACRRVGEAPRAEWRREPGVGSWCSYPGSGRGGALAGRSDRGLAHDLTTGHVTLVLDAGVVLDHSVVLDHGPLPHVRGVTGLHAMAHTCLVTDHRPVDL